MIYFWIYILLNVNLLFVCGVPKEQCEECVPVENCAFYGQLNNKEKEDWVERFQSQCQDSQTNKSSPMFGFSSKAKGDLVCCPNFIWGAENKKRPSNNYQINLSKNNHNSHKPSTEPNVQRVKTERLPTYENQNHNADIKNNKNFDIANMFGGLPDNNFNNMYNPYQQGPWYNNRKPMSNPIQQGFVQNQNPYFQSVNRNNNMEGNPFGAGNLGGQCPVTSLPPDSQSGCCGREATDPDRITAQSPNFSQNRWNSRYNRAYPRINSPLKLWKSPMDNYRNYGRYKRSPDEEKVNVTIDNRIAGGKETELEQFPWTVLLKTTFDYVKNTASFSCGGSLISSRYVLTAGHCVVDEGAIVIDVEVYLSEFDKRTFPKDCKIVFGKGQKCVENIVMHAEDVISHPNYDENRLYNDIALIRLRGNAPYTDYIRPICLPPINIDDPDFFNLRLSVAGWGRNGKYKSDIKQSTFVNLVPQRQCVKYYPHLSKMQLCAAGHSGEDTCKGDSGGPLMMVYEGKYFVAGVVSGKRADSPCGTSVPSLYTNIYHYLQWIGEHIKN
ncbi:vitamin K-dependent protein C-like [Galleria mellonella]|uniref:Vitamin K-dependent protein C-like n=1 Tax=Galleria mellonella TaxID=7137 RepID=A0A6J1WHV1_GALME|nr:vitamin K-dependent protein C-like [Galleria mellonella]